MNLEQKVLELEKRVAELEKQVAAATTTSINWQGLAEHWENLSTGKRRIRGTFNYS